MNITPNGSAPVGSSQFNDTIERIYNKIDDIHKDISEASVLLARLETAFKIKSGIWGLLGGLIPVVIALACLLIKSKVK